MCSVFFAWYHLHVLGLDYGWLTVSYGHVTAIVKVLVVTDNKGLYPLSPNSDQHQIFSSLYQCTITDTDHENLANDHHT